MDIIRPISRRERRIVAAVDRRANAKMFAGCGDCGPRNEFGQYRAVISSMGRMFDNEAVVRAAHSKGNSPQVTKAAQLAGATAMGLAATAPAERVKTLAAITNPQFAAEVNGVAAKFPKKLDVEDRARFALMIVLLPGVEEANRGMATHRSDAVMKLDQGLLLALSRMDKPKSGLGGLGLVTDPNKLDSRGCNVYSIYYNQSDFNRLATMGLKYSARWGADKIAPGQYAQDVMRLPLCTDAEWAALVEKYPPLPPATPGCNEPLKAGEDWIKESCSTFNTQDNRNAKIALIKVAFRDVTGKAADNCALNYYSQMRWCSAETYRLAIKENEARRLAGQAPDAKDTAPRNLLTNIADAASSVADFFSQIGDKLVEWISKATEAASAAFCRGFKALLGDTVGGVLCTIFDVLFKLIGGTLKAAFTIIMQALTALVEFIGKLFKGDFVGAAVSLFSRINTIVLLAIGGPLADLLGIPFTKADATRQGKDPAESFVGLGERLAKKDMLFTVNLAIAIVNVILVTTATGLTAGAAAVALRLAIGMLVMVLAEAVGIVYAPQLMKLDTFKDTPREKVETGIALAVKLTALVVMAVMTLYDFVVKIKTSVMKWWEGMKAKSAEAGGWGKMLASGAGGVWDKIKDAAQKTWNQLKTWPVKFKEIGDGIKELVKVLPIMLLAIVDDSDGNLKALTEETKAGFTQAAKDVKTAQTVWNESTKNLSPQEKLKASGYEPVIKTKDEQIAELQKQLAETNLKLKKTQGDLTAEQRRNRNLVASLAPGSTVSSTGKVTAPKKNVAGPLALATGGFLVGGPIGAAVGLAVGLSAGAKKQAMA